MTTATLTSPTEASQAIVERAQGVGSTTAATAVATTVATTAATTVAARAFVGTVLGDRRFRFLVAGGLNTGFGLICFAVYQHTVGIHWGYMVTLLMTHVTSVLFAFATHRSFVFRVSGNLLADLWRFESVYLTALGINAILLPLLVEVGGAPVLVAQAAITALNVGLSWLGHSRFSFRRA